VYIYKDDSNYGKQSLLKHNNGVHNYTLHEIDFVSKRLGKDIGITFNKEILMNGTNDLIVAIKSALIDSREDFTADTSVKKNYELCEKAVKKELIDLMTCPEAKLSAIHRSKRIQLGEPLPSIVSIKKSKSKPKPTVVSINIPLVETENVNSSEDDNISELSDPYIPEIINENINPLPIYDNNITQVICDMTDSITDVDPDINSNVDPNVDTNVDPNVDPDINSNVDTNVDPEEDFSERRRRTVIIMDYLHKSISGSNDDILPEEILKIIESIFK